MQAYELRALLSNRLKSRDLSFLAEFNLNNKETQAFLIVAEQAASSQAFPEVNRSSQQLQKSRINSAYLDFLKKKEVLNKGSSKNRWRLSGKLLTALSGEEVPDDLSPIGNPVLELIKQLRGAELETISLDRALIEESCTRLKMSEQLFRLLLEDLNANGQIRVEQDQDLIIVAFPTETAEGDEPMAERSDFETVQAFLSQFKPEDEAVVAAFGFGGRKAEVLFAGLNAIGKETGLDLVNFVTVSDKLVSGSSFYRDQLKKAGVIKRGAKRGDWQLTGKAMNKIRALLDGQAPPTDETDALPADEAPARKRGRPRKESAPTPAPSAAPNFRLPPRIAGQTLAEFLKNLRMQVEECDQQIARLTQKRDQLNARTQAIVAAFK